MSNKPSQAHGQAHGLTYPFSETPERGKVIEVADGVFWMRHLMPDMGLDHINVWILRDGDGWVIVDTCINTKSAQADWQQVFEEFMQGRPVTRVIGTHMHPDHIGLAGWIVNRFDAAFMMSRTDYFLCRIMSADTGLKAPPEGVRFYQRAGFSEESLHVYKDRFGSFGSYIFPLPQSFTRIQQGDEIKIGEHMWRVEMGSGHTPEHACLFCEALNVLISGDQILPRISSNISLFPTEPDANPLQDWIDSCARLRDVFPENVLVLPAHNEPFIGIKKRLQALIDGHENGLARLRDVCATPQRAVDKDVFSVLFKRPIDRNNYFMATGESLAHMMCLVHRGEVSQTLKDDIWYFEAV